jgi:NADH-quinone oxidoreductase subunit N
MTMPSPDIQYGQLSPMLIVFAVAVAGVLVEAFLPSRSRYAGHVVLGLGGLGAAFVAVCLLAGTENQAVMGSVTVDGPTLFLQGTIVAVSFVAYLLVAERRIEVGAGSHRRALAFTPRASTVPGSVAEKEAVEAGVAQTEVFPLTLFAVAGMMLFPASGDLLTMFVALEVFSLPLYLLCGMARRNRLLSQESALKYFLLGAFSSAFFLFGIALLYGYAGTLDLTGIAAAIDAGDGSDRGLALIGMGMLAVGLLFKVGAVPFHSWIPDVYQGAPTPITAFMAAVTKIAAFGAMLRIFYVALPGLKDEWRPLLWVVAIATMVVGSIVAITQTDVKRMLAYSSVAHGGFVLTGVAAANDAGVAATMFYLLAYGFSTLGAFAVVTLVRTGGQAGGRSEIGGAEATTMRDWAGLGRRSPVLGSVFALFLLSFAGIPLTSGFVGKFAVFSAASSGGAVPLVLVGVVCSAIAAFFYVRVIVLMFFTDSPPDPPQVVTPGPCTALTIAVGAVVTIVLGILPQPALDLAEQASSFLR